MNLIFFVPLNFNCKICNIFFFFSFVYFFPFFSEGNNVHHLFIFIRILLSNVCYTVFNTCGSIRRWNFYDAKLPNFVNSKEMPYSQGISFRLRITRKNCWEIIATFTFCFSIIKLKCKIWLV